MNNRPPDELDGARVIQWAWSGSEPFGFVSGADPSEIFGLAIATYDGYRFCRFSCDKDWKVVQDDCYDSIDQAKEDMPHQYCNVGASWLKVQRSVSWQVHEG